MDPNRGIAVDIEDHEPSADKSDDQLKKLHEKTLQCTPPHSVNNTIPASTLLCDENVEPPSLPRRANRKRKLNDKTQYDNDNRTNDGDAHYMGERYNKSFEASRKEHIRRRLFNEVQDKRKDDEEEIDKRISGINSNLHNIYNVLIYWSEKINKNEEMIVKQNEKIQDLESLVHKLQSLTASLLTEYTKMIAEINQAKKIDSLSDHSSNGKEINPKQQSQQKNDDDELKNGTRNKITVMMHENYNDMLNMALKFGDTMAYIKRKQEELKEEQENIQRQQQQQLGYFTNQQSNPMQISPQAILHQQQPSTPYLSLNIQDHHHHSGKHTLYTHNNRKGR